MDDLLKAEIKGKLVMPVAFLSLVVKEGDPKDPKVKIAKSSLESLWEIVELLKGEEDA